MVAASLLTTLLLALAIANASKADLERKSPIRLPLTRRRILSNHSIVESRTFRRRGSENQNDSDGAPIRTPALYHANCFTVNIGVGFPPSNYTLILDSGSSNTWVGANPDNPYKQTNTSQRTNTSVVIHYGSFYFRGVEYNDQVTIGSDSKLLIPNQSIGVASDVSKGLVGVDGVLGIGPSDLSIGTLFPDNTSSIPTVTDNLFTSGVITESLVAVFFQPYNFSNPRGTIDAEITWGGIDRSLYIGDITYANITSRSNASDYWGIDVSMTYGPMNLSIISNGTGIVDTGTTFVLLAPDALDKYQNATGAIFDNKTNLLTINSSRFNELRDLNINIAGVNFTLTVDAQVWPRYFVYGGDTDLIYLAIGRLNDSVGFDLVLGQVFHERFYSVYDTANKRVGLAQTNFTYATVNNN